MKILITGAAGNLGSLLVRRLAHGPHHLNLLTHRTDMPFKVAGIKNITVFKGDLGDPATLLKSCEGVDCVVHFAGKLFAPRPDSFLNRTNVQYVKNMVNTAVSTGVDRFILISFPHVEGESTPEHPAGYGLGGTPASSHARTRLAAEKYLFQRCENEKMTPVALRAGMIYGRGVLMIDAARWLLKYRLLAVWKKPTWIHLISLPDFLACVIAAIEKKGIRGIYNLGDDHPTTLQAFLDAAGRHWFARKPMRLPFGLIYAAACACELFALAFNTQSPLTRDFIRIGRASYTADTSRMKEELLPSLDYPDFKKGLSLL